MSATTIIITGFVLMAFAFAFIAIVAAYNAKARQGKLRQRFGPEYDRALAEYGSSKRAERDLVARTKRVKKLPIRDLENEERLRYSSSWQKVQALFVDDPMGAVQEADALIKIVMRQRGYPVEDFDQRIADLSVDHPHVIQHYRTARALGWANRGGHANTEELRRAFVHYRSLFADLLWDRSDRRSSAPKPSAPREVHA